MHCGPGIAMSAGTPQEQARHLKLSVVLRLHGMPPPVFTLKVLTHATEHCVTWNGKELRTPAPDNCPESCAHSTPGAARGPQAGARPTAAQRRKRHPKAQVSDRVQVWHTVLGTIMGKTRRSGGGKMAGEGADSSDQVCQSAAQLHNRGMHVSSTAGTAKQAPSQIGGSSPLPVSQKAYAGPMASLRGGSGHEPHRPCKVCLWSVSKAPATVRMSRLR